MKGSQKPGRSSKHPQPSTPDPVPRLPAVPLFTDYAQAEAFAAARNDLFYLAAFFIQSWLGDLLDAAAAQFADHKNPRDRSFQDGNAWRHFNETFGQLLRKGFQAPLAFLYRFALSDRSSGNSIRTALIPLLVEHQFTGNFCGPATFEYTGPDSVPNDLAARTISRWCDWLDAAIHLRIHRRWHAAPDCFDPDEETRRLAMLGLAQRDLAKLDPAGKAAWDLDFKQASEQFKNSPKWTALAKGLTAQPNLWQYPDVDTAVIALWPLIKQYNWTYRDLLHVIRPGLKRPNAYPCEAERSFATYCGNVLALRKSQRGPRGRIGNPPGYEIAVWLCPGFQQKQTKETKRE